MKDFIKNQLESADKFKIVFFGDSTTSAEWVHPNWREIVEYVLKDKLGDEMTDWSIPSWGIRCFNAGFDGASTDDLIELLDNEVLVYKPDLVILMATSNDIFANINPDKHTENIKTLLDKILKSGTQVIYSTDIPAYNDEYNQKYKLYAEKVTTLFPYNVPFINMFEKYSKFDLSKFFTFKCPGNEVVGIKPGEIDYLHPNILGNAYIAKIILKDVFETEFDPEIYIRDFNNGVMFPEY